MTDRDPSPDSPPARNVEIKARVADLGAVERRARARSGGEPELLLQRDVYFRVPNGRLKLRTFAGDRPGELLAYSRPDVAGPKTSQYRKLPVADPPAMEALLGEALGVLATVEKERRLLHIGQTRVHLDRVARLGEFVELEVVLAPEESAADGEAIARRLLDELGIEPDELVAGSYLDLLLAL